VSLFDNFRNLFLTNWFGSGWVHIDMKFNGKRHLKIQAGECAQLGQNHCAKSLQR
jgi:hypothetical protein